VLQEQEVVAVVAILILDQEDLAEVELEEHQVVNLIQMEQLELLILVVAVEVDLMITLLWGLE
jgi:hypothetical protein